MKALVRLAVTVACLLTAGPASAGKPGPGAPPPTTTCKSCHGTPPRGHAAGYDCGKCHPGFTANSTNDALHRNRVVNVDTAAIAVPPACGDGLRFEILSAVVAEGQRPAVTFQVSDASGAPIDLLAEMTSTPVKLAPRFTLAALQADGKYRSYKFANVAPLGYTKPDGTVVTFPPDAPTATQAAAETAAATRVVAQGGGIYTYTFASPVTGVASDATHTVAVFGNRLLPACSYPTSATYDFVPAGGAPSGRDVVAQGACDRCHGHLQAHGTTAGARRGVKVCLTCHSPQTTDPETGNTLDLAVLVHKIHDGANLANGYAIVAHQQTYWDVSHIVMAPSHSGYFEGVGTYASAHDPGLARECGLCHDASAAAQASLAYTNPTQRACGACHDAVDFATGAGHAGGAQAGDGECALCHVDGSVRKVHSRFYEPTFGIDFQDPAQVSPPIPDGGHRFEATLVSVANAGTQLTWTVDFALDGAPLDIKTMGATFRWATCAFNVAGPTTDYVLPANGATTGGSCTTLASWVAVAGVPGRFTYGTANWFTAAPAKADGYYTAAFEIMIQRVYGSGTSVLRKPFSANPNFLTLANAAGTVSVVTDAAALLANARRTVVEFAKCNGCHVDLGFHSNRGRKGPGYCATCHNPMLDNGTRARFTVAEAYPVPGSTALGYLPESVSMNVYIHRIHMGSRLPSVAGSELTGTGVAARTALRSPWVADQNGAPSIVFGATRSAFIGLDTNGDGVEDAAPEVADFTGFAQPNPMNRCEQCHVAVGAKQTWALPEQPGLAAVRREYRECLPSATRPSWATEDWCANASVNGPAKVAGVAPVYTPPLKAVCTSCHDSAATDAHADLNTMGPMTAAAVELCSGCHGAGQTWDALNVHRSLP